MDQDQAKRAVARAAVAELPERGTVGLGTGSTARCFVEEVAMLVRSGRELLAVATSKASRAYAQALGITVLDDDGDWSIDVTVDGADEVDADLNLIKGGGGAHTREKIVSFASSRNVIVVDETKVSTRLGEKKPVPVEVLPFGHLATARHLARFGSPVLRRGRDGLEARTDAGNFVYDLHVPPIADPGALDRALRAIPGVVETGLFVGRADVVFIGTGPHVVRRARGERLGA